MPARIQEDMHLAFLVAAEDNRLFSHSRGIEVAGVRDQAFVADQEPRSGKDLVQFLLVEVRIDEDIPTDEASLEVDEMVESASLGHGFTLRGRMRR
jgi:hypothetical protein